MGTQPLSTRPYKGTRDFYPDEMRLRRWMFDRLKGAVERYGYQEYDGPMLEPFELYAAKSGEEIVNQQLYWMMDRGERKLAVRPEMTPTLARMVAGKANELPRPIRWYSIPNLWRYERPQRGRLREHWQLNVDVLGGDALLADAEILSVAFDVVDAFGGGDRIAIRVNNRRLMDRFFQGELGLDAEGALKTSKAVDARDKIGEEAYAKWLSEIGIDDSQRAKMERFFKSGFDDIAASLSGEGVDELKRLFEVLKATGKGDRVVFDPMIMRGLDYYTGTVFEIYDTSPENRRALFGGGRYDNLVGLFGKQQLPGVGFGMGDVGLMNFLETHKLVPSLGAFVDVFVSLPSEGLVTEQLQVAGALRSAGLTAITPLAAGGFGAQLKLASKHHARFAVLFGESELAERKVVLKDLASGEQHTVAIAELAERIVAMKNAGA